MTTLTLAIRRKEPECSNLPKVMRYVCVLIQVRVCVCVYASIM